MHRGIGMGNFIRHIVVKILLIFLFFSKSLTLLYISEFPSNSLGVSNVGGIAHPPYSSSEPYYV
jgi:hypothetical protein